MIKSFFINVFKKLLLKVGFELKRSIKLGKSVSIGSFKDERGNSFDLLAGYKRRIWGADWNNMLENREEPTEDTVKRLKMLEHGRNQVSAMREYLGLFNIRLKGKRVLEIGCFSGAASYSLVELGVDAVEGIDVSEHFTNKTSPNSAEVDYWIDYLIKFRQAVRCVFEQDGAAAYDYEAVCFCNSNIVDFEAKEKYDLVLSWDTLEHILDPNAAFLSIYNALSSGGYSAHRYHPFFCESGAHYDTLDFPWGHVRLSSADFLSYLRNYRPDEIDIGEWRFFSTLGRTTITQMYQAMENAGLDVIDIAVSTNPSLNVLPAAIMKQCKANYPSITTTDLLSSQVWLLARKK